VGAFSTREINLFSTQVGAFSLITWEHFGLTKTHPAAIRMMAGLKALAGAEKHPNRLKPRVQVAQKCNAPRRGIALGAIWYNPHQLGSKGKPPAEKGAVPPKIPHPPSEEDKALNRAFYDM